MKSSLRCLGLAGILGLTLWASAPRAVQAAPPFCEDLQGKSCQPYNSTTPCVWEADRSRSSCWCYFLQGWICFETS